MTTPPIGDLGVSISDLAEELDRTGFVCLENVVSRQWLAEAREYVKISLAEYGEFDFCILRPANKKDSPPHRFVSDPTVRSIFERLALARCPQGVAKNEEIYSVLRVLAGEESVASSFRFHYDAAIVTMLVPIIIPTASAGKSGELVVFPNRRPIRRSVFFNIFEKIATQNRFFRKRIIRELNNAPEEHAVQLKPGNAYLFWGYRTFHGNLPCAPNTIRATLLLHYGNPHGRHPALLGAKYVRRIVSPSSEHPEATVVRL